jgi:23S rRNA pseudouridine1911/1915/1917 synthase
MTPGDMTPGDMPRARRYQANIGEVLAGDRVDRVVALVTELARARAAVLLRSGAVTVDGVVVTVASRRLAAGQLLEINVPEDTDSAVGPDDSVVFEVVYVDDDVVVVDKPAGLVVHPGSGHHGATLVNGLLARFADIAGVGDPARPGIVHRLDKGTTGLMMVARSQRAYHALVSQLVAHEAGRQYLAFVWGILQASSGMVDAPIGRSPRDPLRMAVVNDGRPARTGYELIEAIEAEYPVSLVQCRLETGRTHQIRVHMAAIGHPVVGDPLYKRGARSAPVTRPMLHAARLSFRHPVTDETLVFESAMPADMTAYGEALRASALAIAQTGDEPDPRSGDRASEDAR